MMNQPDKLSHARRVLAGVEKSGAAAGPGWTASLSVPVIDDCLSMGGIIAPSFHEVHGGAGSDAENNSGNGTGNGAASGFALWLAGLAMMRAAGPVFWIAAPHVHDSDSLYPPALDNRLQETLIMVEARQRRDVLWAFEEILASGQAACVIAETGQVDLTAARRLQLASERGRSLAVALCRSGPSTKAGAAPGNSVARTRWRVGTCRDGWQLELMGGRGVRPGEWKVRPKIDATAFSLHLVSASGDGSSAEHQHAA